MGLDHSGFVLKDSNGASKDESDALAIAAG
jgi:hypothetical protein